MGDSEAFRRTEPFGRATTSSVLAKPRFELRIGSNIFRNTNGVVTIHGKEQLVIDIQNEALADAYATAQLMLVLLAEADRQGIGAARDLYAAERGRRWLG